MARRQLLGDDAWAHHLEPAADEREITRHYTLGADDLVQVTAKRGDANRLGYALVLLYLRYPGRVLETGEAPPASIVAYVAHQVGAPVSALDDYGRRDAARRTHLAVAMRTGGFTVFDRAAAHEVLSVLTAAAQTIVRPGHLAGILIEELRRKRVLLPPALVLETVIRGARQRAERVGTDDGQPCGGADVGYARAMTNAPVPAAAEPSDPAERSARTGRGSNTVVARGYEIDKLTALCALLTERPAVFPTEVGQPVLPLAIGILEALKPIMRPETTEAQLKDALRVYSRSLAYLLAQSRPGSWRYDLSGIPVA